MTSFLGGGSSLPIGTMLDYAGGVVPNNFKICDFSEMPRTGIGARLFKAIGVSYGAGNGTTTYNLPDSHRRIMLPTTINSLGLPNWTAFSASTNIGTLSESYITLNNAYLNTTGSSGSVSMTHQRLSKKGKSTGKYYLAAKINKFMEIDVGYFRVYNTDFSIKIGVCQSNLSSLTTANDYKSSPYFLANINYRRTTTDGTDTTGIETTQNVKIFSQAQSAGTTIPILPASSDVIIICFDLDSKQWHIRSTTADYNNCTVLSGTMPAGNYYPFFEVLTKGSVAVDFLKESELVANGAALSDVTGFINWFDTFQYDVGVVGGAESNTYTDNGTILTLANLPSTPINLPQKTQTTTINAGYGTQFAAAESGNPQSTLILGSNQAHTHTINNVSTIQPYFTGLKIIKYR